MKVKLSRTFPMPASADAAWALLGDVAGVAACLPGAAITERIDATRYKGTVSVKVGPASLSFRGEIEVRRADAATRTLHLFASGTDTTGGSAASMDLSARVDAGGANACNLVGDSEVSMSGRAASFGARLIGPVSDQVMNQFAANFAARLQATPAASTATQTAAPPPPSKPLNAFAVAWSIFAGWLRSVFAKKS